MEHGTKTMSIPSDPQCPCLRSCRRSLLQDRYARDTPQDRHRTTCADCAHTLLYHLSNDHMTDNLGFGRERRQALNQDVLHNRTTFRDSFREMLASVSETTSFEDCQRILKKSALISACPQCSLASTADLIAPFVISPPLADIKLDPGFKEFFGGPGLSLVSRVRTKLRAASYSTLAQTGRRAQRCPW